MILRDSGLAGLARRARRGRDAAANARRRTRACPECAASADRRDRRAPLPRTPAAHHGHPRLLRWAARSAAAAAARSASRPTSRPSPALTTRAPCSCACPASTPALHDVGSRVRDLYADGPTQPNGCAAGRRRHLDVLARAVTGELGGRVGVAPRVFLKKLVGDVLDRVDQFPDFDPARDYELTVSDTSCPTGRTRGRRGARAADDVELDLPDRRRRCERLHPTLGTTSSTRLGWPAPAAAAAGDRAGCWPARDALASRRRPAARPRRRCFRSFPRWPRSAGAACRSSTCAR